MRFAMLVHATGHRDQHGCRLVMEYVTFPGGFAVGQESGPMTNARCVRLCVAAMLLSLVSAGCQQNGKAADTDAVASNTQVSSVKTEPQVRGLARLEPKSGLILVGTQPGIRIESVQVVQGQEVSQGELLAILQGSQSAQGQLELAEAEKATADFERLHKQKLLQLDRQRFDQLRESRIDTFKDRITSLDEKLKIAQANRERATGVDPTSDRIAVQDYIINQTKGELLQTRLQLEEFEKDLELLPFKRELEDEELSDEHPRQKLLSQKIELARVTLEQTRIHAPIKGTVLEVIAHGGEVSSGPLLYLADTTTMSAVVELFQTDVARVQLGDKAYVEIFDKRVAATVTEIGRLVGENKLTSVNPMALTDRRIVKVKLELHESTFASQYVNMQVSAVVFPGTAAKEKEPVSQ